MSATCSLSRLLCVAVHSDEHPERILVKPPAVPGMWFRGPGLYKIAFLTLCILGSGSSSTLLVSKLPTLTPLTVDSSIADIVHPDGLTFTYLHATSNQCQLL